jgi:hypothetical protein
MAALLRFLLLQVLVVVITANNNNEALSCSLPAVDNNIPEQQKQDPALQVLHYDIGHGPQTTLVYVEPNVTAMYQGNPPASTIVVPLFTGFSVKFINMANYPVNLFWVPSDAPDAVPKLQARIVPFHEAGTASTPGHIFTVTDAVDHSIIYKRFVIGEYPDNIQVYDPYVIGQNNNNNNNNSQETERLKLLQEHLNETERQHYEELRQTLKFHEQYKTFTGRSYLANYLRDPPRHFQWTADYFGQEHWVQTHETHFVQSPPEEYLPELTDEQMMRLVGQQDDNGLQEYRKKGTLNMTLKVLSIAPRVFEIHDFLSKTEIDHILQIATKVELSRSMVGDTKDISKHNGTETSRTSFNSWIQRSKSPIIDAIYRRAADLMRIPEALFRNRAQDEMPEFTTKKSLAEQLQLVHYDPGQKYTAHHGTLLTMLLLSTGIHVCVLLFLHSLFFCVKQTLGTEI